MKKNLLKILCVVLAISMLAGSVALLAACDNRKTIYIWGPQEHEAIYMKYANQFLEAHADIFEGYKFQFEGKGDAGAYSAMNVDPTRGAAVYTFANDQTANLVNLGALSQVMGDNLAWSIANNSSTAVASTILGKTEDGSPNYVAYPLQADNGYYMYYNKDAFYGTSIWEGDKETGGLKAGYTFRDMYAALDERAAQAGGEMWSNGKVTWAMGDSWYMSGIFFSVGGDYEVIYNDEGKQAGADCWFCFTLPEGETNWRNGDFTVGYDAFEAAKNTFTNVDGKVNKHYDYTDGDKTGLNNYIDVHSNPDNDAYARAPLAAAVCGTWKASALQEAWGENYAATVLPTLETDDGERFQMKNFAGYKNLGVNPLCSFISDAGTYEDMAARLQVLHELAQYLCGKEISLERHTATGAGPANSEALEDPSVKSDLALIALNKQYELVCKYPDNYSKVELRGQLIGNGVGYRNQDSVPANYWSPIQEYGQLMWTEYNSGKLTTFASQAKITEKLVDLQGQIAKAAQ